MSLCPVGTGLCRRLLASALRPLDGAGLYVGVVTSGLWGVGLLGSRSRGRGVCRGGRATWLWALAASGVVSLGSSPWDFGTSVAWWAGRGAGLSLRVLACGCFGAGTSCGKPVVPLGQDDEVAGFGRRAPVSWASLRTACRGPRWCHRGQGRSWCWGRRNTRWVWRGADVRYADPTRWRGFSRSRRAARVVLVGLLRVSASRRWSRFVWSESAGRAEWPRAASRQRSDSRPVARCSSTQAAV